MLKDEIKELKKRLEKLEKRINNYSDPHVVTIDPWEYGNGTSTFTTWKFTIKDNYYVTYT